MKDGPALLTLANGEDWLLRPVLRGMMRYESLVGYELDLADVALMNDAIDVEAENQRRLDDHQRPEKR